VSGGAESSDLKEYNSKASIKKKIILKNMFDDKEIEVLMVRENTYCYFCIENGIIFSYSKKMWKIEKN
jgi:hypothetical protein